MKKKSRFEEMLEAGPIAINIGLLDLAEDLFAKGVDLVHVQWFPPSQDEKEIKGILDRLL